MNTHLHTSFRRLIPVLLVLVLVMVYSLIQFGCTNRISGTQTENKKPVVFFVNVPPESTKVSRNPVINWIGTDADGQVKYFRYIVVREDSLGGLTPAQFAAQRLTQLDSTLWTYLTVTVDNPATSNSVKMSADLQNPVNHYYPQYVFLQAFDDKNLGSDIIWRLLLRNDNPPITYINAIVGGADNDTSHPFINSVLPGGAITGIRLTWRGSDLIDYPKDPPPFQFQWKLFGPYQYNNSPTDTFHLMIQKWVKKVFLANDGLVYQVGQGAKIIKCDTTLGVESCDTILVDTIRVPGSLGSFDSMMVMNDSFKNDSVYYRLVDSSTSADGTGWTYSTTDTFWDAFRLRRGTTTRQDKFIFWARCRDDASVPDPVPAWRGIDVVDPHYERGVLVVDLVKVSNTVRVNAPFRDTARNYWTRVLTQWANDRGPSFAQDTFKFVKDTDYVFINAGPYLDALPLLKVLAYKVMILYNDDIRASAITQSPTIGPPVYTGIDAGINTWVVARSPLYGGPQNLPQFPVSALYLGDQYQRYFGVESMVYSGWTWWALGVGASCNRVRIEDFVGGLSLDPVKWPDLSLDTLQLHKRYNWQPIIDKIDTCRNSPTYGQYGLRWRPDIAALPEVDWSVRSFGTEVMYLYKSKDSSGHPLGPLYSFHGAPVAHRLDRGLYRTVHFNFTPLAIADAQAQLVIDTVMNWLWKPTVSGAPTEQTYPYPQSAYKLSIQDAAQNAALRNEEFEQKKPAKMLLPGWRRAR